MSKSIIPMNIGKLLFNMLMLGVFYSSYSHANENVCSFNSADWCVFCYKRD